MDEIRVPSLRLISQHLDFGALMEELSSVHLQHRPLPEFTAATNDGKSIPVSGTSNFTRIPVPVYENAVYESMKLQASLSEMKIEVTGAQIILKELCRVSQDHKIICNDSDHIFAAFCAYKKFGSKLSVQDMMQYKERFKHCLPLNIILQLHDLAVLELKDYLIVHVNNKTILKEFISALQQVTRHLSLNTATKFGSSHVAAGILTHLMKYAYGGGITYSKALKKLCGYVLFNIVKCNLQHLISLPASKSVARASPPILPSISENFREDGETLQKCFTQMITLWITDSPNLKVSDAISLQHTWIASKQNEALTLFYKEITSSIGLENALSTVNNILETREVNWKYLLTFTSAMLVSFPDSPKAFNDLISKKLKSGIETYSVELLTACFLLARQLSLEDSHAFTSYTSWFQDNFGVNSTLISSNRAFRFFLQFLTVIVPYEPVRYLKAHIIKPPHAPPSCAEKLKEYTSSARVRIAELGVSLADVTEDSEQSEEIEKDVKKVLDEYEKISRIPKSLMEASIFQKGYFCKKFLPTLLKPRLLPAAPDTSMKLIEDLIKAQKVPKNMYASYQEGCKKENEKILQEVMVLDDDSAFEDQEEPLEQFLNILHTIKREISQKFNQEESKLEHISSELPTKLRRLLHSVCDVEPSCDQNYVINLCKEVDHDKALNHMSHALLDWLGGYLEKISTSHKAGGILLEDLTRVLNVTQEQNLFNAEMCNVIWRSCTNEIASLSEIKLKGISLYLTIVGSSVTVKFSPPKICEVEILKCDVFTKSVEDWQNFATAFLIDAVVYCVQFHRDKDSMLAAFKFARYVTENVFLLKRDAITKILDVFTYIGHRIKAANVVVENLTGLYSYPSSKCARTEAHELINCAKIYGELHCRAVQLETKLSKAGFLQQEMKIDTTEDFLTEEERHNLYVEIFFKTDSSRTDLQSVLHTMLDDFCFNDEKKLMKRNQEVTSFMFRSLPLMLEGCADIKSNAEFVYDVLSTRLDQCDASDLIGEIRWQNEMRVFLMLLLNLPPSFLFRHTVPDVEMDNIWSNNCGKDNQNNLDFVGKLVNEFFFHMEKESSHSFSLSRNVTNHLIHGLFEHAPLGEFLPFCIVLCPCLFISLLTHWVKDPGLQYLIRIRNPNLHSVINDVHASLSGKGSILGAYEILHSSVLQSPKIAVLYEERADVKSAIKLCLACSFFDMAAGMDITCVDDLKRWMDGLELQMLGYLGSCAILKMFNPSEFTRTSEVQVVVKTTLVYFCNTVDAEYACDILMASKLPGILRMVSHRSRSTEYFDISVLKGLTEIAIPQRLLKSKFFLPAFLHLKQRTMTYFKKNHTLMVEEFEPLLQRVESLVLRSAPDVAIINFLQKYGMEEDLKRILHCEATRRRLPISLI